MQTEKEGKVPFSFWKMVLICGAINLPLAFLLLRTFDIEPLLMFASILATISLAAWLCYKRQVKSIWFIPVAQILLTVCVGIFLFLRDVVGLRSPGGFIDLGVGFEIAVMTVLGLCWIVPSAIASAIYSVVKRRSEQRKECKNGKADPT